jgi:hypothetical protein
LLASKPAPHLIIGRGNITGFITTEPTMAGKWVEFLKEIAPRVTNCILLFNPEINDAAASLAVKGSIAKVRDVGELEIIAAQAREPNGDLVVMPDTFMTLHRAKITALADKHAPQRSILSVFTLRVADCCRTETTPMTVFGAPPPMPIVS